MRPSRAEAAMAGAMLAMPMALRAISTGLFLLLSVTAASAEFETVGTLAKSVFDIYKSSKKISYDEEAAIGETISLQALARAGRVVQDDQLLEYVTLVGMTVAKASHRPHTPYYFAVCDNSDVNAFAVPGGYIFVTTGLLKHVKSEEELAGVLGHEIAHVALQHAVKAARKADVGGTVTGTVASLLSSEVGALDLYGDLIGKSVEIITEKGFEFEDEAEADELGCEFAFRAGYRAQGLQDFIRTLAGFEKEKREFALFRTHRDHDKRVLKLDEFFQKRRYEETPANPALVERFNANLRDRLREDGSGKGGGQ